MPTLERIAADRAIAEGLRCSFCDREPAPDSALASGPDVFICDECVATCSDLLMRDDPPADTPSEHDEPEAPSAESGSSIMEPTRFRLLTDADVASLTTSHDVIEAMETALRRFSSGETVQPVRTVLPLGSGHDVFGVMPAYVREPAIVGAKLVTVFTGNATLDLPTHQSTILLFAPDDGRLMAVLGGRHITEVRTAAVSAISADLLARDDTAVLAIIGSGRQARSHLSALEEVFELSEVRVWSPTPEHQMAFLEEMKSDGAAPLVGAQTAEQAVRGADLVVLATSASEPVVQSEWIKDGAHVISVGACRPDQREMDPALVRRGRLYVDSLEAARVESGDIVLGIKERRFDASHIVGELGALIAGKIEGRQSLRDVTIFKSLGLAVEDVVAADLALRRAAARDVGNAGEI
jgi:ornithine cyclodeaminase/alanine dehydrogenase-like protein (mu-crystallin family)